MVWIVHFLIVKVCILTSDEIAFSCNAMLIDFILQDTVVRNFVANLFALSWVEHL